MPKAHANGIDIYYEVKGAGDPLLLIAGFASDLTIWSKVAPSLAEQYQVIVFDNRGVGRSSAPDRPYSIRQMVDDAAALLDQIGEGGTRRWPLDGWDDRAGVSHRPLREGRQLAAAEANRLETDAQSVLP